MGEKGGRLPFEATTFGGTVLPTVSLIDSVVPLGRLVEFTLSVVP